MGNKNPKYQEVYLVFTFLKIIGFVFIYIVYVEIEAWRQVVLEHEESMRRTRLIWGDPTFDSRLGKGGGGYKVGRGKDGKRRGKY